MQIAFLCFNRIEYDAYRTDLETSKTDAATLNNPETQENFNKHKESYEKLRADVAVKMQFLDENRVCSFPVLLFSEYTKN